MIEFCGSANDATRKVLNRLKFIKITLSCVAPYVGTVKKFAKNLGINNYSQCTLVKGMFHPVDLAKAFHTCRDGGNYVLVVC